MAGVINHEGRVDVNEDPGHPKRSLYTPDDHSVCSCIQYCRINHSFHRIQRVLCDVFPEMGILVESKNHGGWFFNRSARNLFEIPEQFVADVLTNRIKSVFLMSNREFWITIDCNFTIIRYPHSTFHKFHLDNRYKKQLVFHPVRERELEKLVT
uniref:Uncharacterized protein n=1 Tax=Strigamia maritima TaxID=126957 RepID=T1JFY0_STRMM